ncbi:ATP-binding protein [Dactylosporangium sp. NPDC049140]|uniref:sensor histidine kinase n=1 Tax=Dactylosporangium sp. NPDC049140 TaxID=3155647 RepID=UPI0033C3C001
MPAEGSLREAATWPSAGFIWRPRPGWGLLAAAVMLSVVTVIGLRLRDSAGVALPSAVLVYLVAVVVVAVVGGTWPAIAAAVASDALINWYFTPPYHTLTVAHRENVTALVVYVLVAVTVSVLVNLAAAQRAAAVRSGLEARLLARITAEPVEEQSLQRLLERLRATFGFTALALWEGDEPVAHAGPGFTGPPTLRVDAGNRLLLVAESPATIGEDRALLARLAAGAARTLEAQRLAVRAARAEQLAEVDRLRTAILRAVGHDLRTPLAAIKAAASSLASPDVTFTEGDRAELVATVVESADRLDDLIENLLALSRLQAGVLSAQPRPVALDEIVARAALSVGPGRLAIDVPDDLPWVRADPGLLERVIANLVDNAVRIGGGDRIALRAAVHDDTVRLAVVDHGPGIPAAERERIFAPFQRLGDQSADGRLGLGLAIARGFTDAMGGRLYPSDTPGGGLTMTIELPLAATGEA